MLSQIFMGGVTKKVSPSPRRSAFWLWRTGDRSCSVPFKELTVFCLCPEIIFQVASIQTVAIGNIMLKL